MKSNTPEEMRLQAYIAKSGFCSRRKAETFIMAGKVSVNGVSEKNPARRVTGEDTVFCNGTLIEMVERVYIALNKPKGYLCSNSDPHGVLFARDLIQIPQQQTLFSIGRLDRDSTGLILFTNDGDFAQAVSHPSYGIEKEYLVKTREKLDRSVLNRALTGIRVEGETYRISRLRMHSSRSVSIILLEGKNREIRKIMKALGYSVTMLHRVRIGTLTIGKLPKGAYRFLTRHERRALTGSSS